MGHTQLVGLQQQQQKHRIAKEDAGNDTGQHQRHPDVRVEGGSISRELLPLSVPRFRYDLCRALRLLLFSACTSPVPHYWYLNLDASIMPESPTAPQARYGLGFRDTQCSTVQ